MAELRRFSTLNGLDRKTLHKLANAVVISRAAAGSVLLEPGSRDDNTLYLMAGRLRLIAADGKVKEIDEQDRSARDPIARLRPSQYQVVALSHVNYLRIDNALLASVEQWGESSLLSDAYQVSEEQEFTDMSAENRLLIKIFQDLNTDQLALPTLPQVAARLGQVMKDPALDANLLAKVVSIDPAVCAKLLKATNSARFGGQAPIKTLPHAIARLGIDTTYQLALSFAIQELFRTGSQALQQHMDNLWRHSRRVAAICQVLASRMAGRFDPAFALLAGLLHDIGVLAVLGYARDCPDLAQIDQHIDEAIARLRAQLGSAIVRRWQLPDELALVVQEADNWWRDHGQQADYADLMIVAQLQCFVATPRASEVPRLDQVPAYRKLNLGALTPAFSLQLLEEADDEIRAVEQLLGD
jgi:HD-like signal output (HDOD) protein